jgi:hypothetical protein
MLLCLKPPLLYCVANASYVLDIYSLIIFSYGHIICSYFLFETYCQM